MSYPGGKNGSGVYQAIINQMPPHAVYIEPFLGAGAIMRLKRPASCSIGIDIDADVLTRWTGAEIPGLQIIGADALHWLASTTFTSDTLVYLDPPYLRHVRSCQRRIYRCEFDQVYQHEHLLQLILTLPCMVAISGYYSPLYANLLHNWRSIQYTAQTRSGRPVQEWLWMNYPQPVELHDYRFLGKNFRERERITRKRKRWIERLKRMPETERYSLLSALEYFRSTTP
jgi:site-specific DNA-adenine methylase